MHAGFAISVIDEDEAQKTLEAFAEVAALLEDDGSREPGRGLSIERHNHAATATVPSVTAATGVAR